MLYNQSVMWKEIFNQKLSRIANGIMVGFMVGSCLYTGLYLQHLGLSLSLRLLICTPIMLLAGFIFSILHYFWTTARNKK